MIPRWKRNYLRYKSYLVSVLATYQKRRDLQSYLEVLLSLTSIIVFGVFAIRPTVSTIAKLLKEVNSKQQTIAVMDQKIAALASARAVYDSQQANIALLKLAVPEAPQPGELARQVEGVSNQSGTLVRGFTTEDVPLVAPQQPANANELAKFTPLTIPFTLSVTSSYQALINLVTQTQNLLRPVNLTSVAFNQAGQLSGGNELVLTITGEVPYLTK